MSPGSRRVEPGASSAHTGAREPEAPGLNPQQCTQELAKISSWLQASCLIKDLGSQDLPSSRCTHRHTPYWLWLCPPACSLFPQQVASPKPTHGFMGGPPQPFSHLPCNEGAVRMTQAPPLSQGRVSPHQRRSSNSGTGSASWESQRLGGILPLEPWPPVPLSQSQAQRRHQRNTVPPIPQTPPRPQAPHLHGNTLSISVTLRPLSPRY